MIGQSRLAAHLHAARFRPLAALAGAGADQLFLELGQAAEHGQHQAAGLRGTPAPCFKGLEWQFDMLVLDEVAPLALPRQP